jgi:aryl-alcohol dehydrogenase-like predicted oxidoreductase
VDKKEIQGEEMEKRKLGNANISITTLGYGSMELRHVTEPEATRLLNAALDGGINYVDTSPDYGPSEEYIGKAIAHRRHEFFLATKCGCNIDPTGKLLTPQHIYSRQKLLENIENSLRLLKTDYIDVWQLHGAFPEEMPGGKNGEVIQTLLELKGQGKIRAIGMSYKNGSANDVLHPDGYALKYAPEYIPWNIFDVMQIVYGGLTRRAEQIIADVAANGIGVVVRGVVKKYRANYGELFAQAKLSELCGPGESMDDFLVRFALNHPGISTMIIGTKNPDHLKANIQAVTKGALPVPIYAEAQKRLDAIGVVVQE